MLCHIKLLDLVEILVKLNKLIIFASGFKILTKFLLFLKKEKNHKIDKAYIKVLPFIHKVYDKSNSLQVPFLHNSLFRHTELIQ